MRSSADATSHQRRIGPLWIALVSLSLSLASCGSDRVTLPRGSVSVDGKRIAVHDNCHDEPQLDVTESRSTVEIRFTVAAETGGDCFSCTVATLDAPLGDRTVIDAATGQAIPTTGDCFTELE
jgi:hypothetical protein